MRRVVEAIERLYHRAHMRVSERVKTGDRVDAKKLERAQLAAHALAYMATELEACRQLVAWAERVDGDDERAIARGYIGETARALAGGVDLGPVEHIGLGDLGLARADLRESIYDAAVEAFIAEHATGDAVVAIAESARERGTGDPGLDGMHEDIRKEFARFTDAEVSPRAQDIHRRDLLIPMELIAQMSELGVFGLTISEQYGGLGLDKVALCVVTEELSRGYIGVGSLGTRADIAAELIEGAGTDAQKTKWLPRIASGETMSTAVFTEPNHGSDLAHITTRAVREPDGGYRLYGQKTWITHALRADLMTVLARTNPDESGYAGLSMFLAEKDRWSERDDDPPFRDGLSGTEIPVLGYRGMKEHELSFDGFHVGAEGLLGGEEGAGFKQLMRTFESARIQTAARGVGLAKAALDDALLYSVERSQFGQPIFEFPRVARKIGRMVARVQAARQLAFHAARRKDSGARCDLEAGMAKLLATRVAWEAADANVQIHGGNGFAEEYLASRLLVDARVLSIFEGANEIQAHVVARRLLDSAPE